MKLHFSLTPFLLLVLTVLVLAQEKPQALKFDEFNDSDESHTYWYYERNISFSERTERFIKQLKKQRASKAFIIYYQARITSAGNNFKNKVNGIQFRVQSEAQVKSEDIFVFDGGYREENSIEFWIAPPNADAPAPTPTFDKSETFVCPNIYVQNNTPPGNTETVNFIVRTGDYLRPENYSVTWRVSAGEIIEGKGGADAIRVKVNDSAKRVTAYAEIGGLPFPCPKVFSETAESNGNLYQVDSFGMVSNGDIKARLDNFWIQLQNNPVAAGYIVVYGNRNEGIQNSERRINMISQYITIRRFDASRVTIVRGGFQETISTDLWLGFDNAVPIPAPTVDKKFIETPAKNRKPRPRRK